jgi:hypothetical protein
MTAGSAVTTLAARARIRELEEGDEWLGARGSRQKDRKENAARREIVDLSVRYSLISRETSFVAIERRDTPIVGEMQLRKVPIALTSGWGGLEVGFHRIAYPAAEGMHMGTVALGFDSDGEQQLFPAMLRATDRRPVKEAAGQFMERAARQGVWEQKRAHRPAELDLLVSLQSADGWWELTEELAAVLRCDVSELERAVPRGAGDPLLARRAWATALAVVWLQVHAGAWEDEWRGLWTKARKWLDGADATAAHGWRWFDAAQNFMAGR